MKDLDTLLLNAWHDVSAELKQKPWSMARRMERVSRKELRRPVRAWCVALRASDGRIGGDDLLIPGAGEDAIERCRRGYTHDLMLRGRRLRELCSAVRIDWPGVGIHEAAKILGRDLRTLYRWSDVGAVDCRREREPGRRGKPTRWVWSDKAIDPQADDGRGPWAVWGTLWQGLADRIPGAFEQVVQRTPRLRDSAKDWRTAGQAWPGKYRGWDWLCPGRVLACGTHVRCGRVCKKLWLPLPVWTIGDALGQRAGEVWQQMPRFENGRTDGAGRSGEESGSHGASYCGGPSGGYCGEPSGGLACSKCWGLRFDNPQSSPAEAWNRFVSVVSGGLLYGREVDRGVLWQKVCA